MKKAQAQNYILIMIVLTIVLAIASGPLLDKLRKTGTSDVTQGIIDTNICIKTQKTIQDYNSDIIAFSGSRVSGELKNTCGELKTKCGFQGKLNSQAKISFENFMVSLKDEQLEFIYSTFKTCFGNSAPPKEVLSNLIIYYKTNHHQSSLLATYQELNNFYPLSVTDDIKIKMADLMVGRDDNLALAYYLEVYNKNKDVNLLSKFGPLYMGKIQINIQKDLFLEAQTTITEFETLLSKMKSSLIVTDYKTKIEKEKLKLIIQNPKSTESQKIEAYKQIAEIYEENKDFSSAIEFYQNILSFSKYPNEIDEAKFRIASLHYKKFNELYSKRMDIDLNNQLGITINKLEELTKIEKYSKQAWELLRSVLHNTYQNKIFDHEIRVKGARDLGIYFNTYAEPLNKIMASNYFKDCDTIAKSTPDAKITDKLLEYHENCLTLKSQLENVGIA